VLVFQHQQIERLLVTRLNLTNQDQIVTFFTHKQGPKAISATGKTGQLRISSWIYPLLRCFSLYLDQITNYAQ